MSASVAEAGVRRFRDRLGLLLLLRHGLLALAVWGLAYGALVLAARAGLGVSREPLLWGLCSLPLVLVLAAVLAYRSLPSPQRVRALIDRHAQCGGLLMASDEADLGEWEGRLRDADGPMPSWKGGRIAALSSIGPAFLLAAFLLPDNLAQAGWPPLDIRRDAERMEEQLKVLKEEKAMDAARADAFKSKLADLRKEAQGRDPVKTLEALDHVQDALNKEAQRAGEAAVKQAEMMAQAKALAEALEKGAGRLDEAMTAEAMAHLGGLWKKLAAEEALKEGHLDEELMDALKKGAKLTKEQLKKLAKALEQGKGDLAKKMEKLMKAKLLDPEALDKMDKAGEADAAALAAYLKENGLDGLADKLLMDDEGNGGTEQGEPGKTKLKFGDESSGEGAKFKEEMLPASELEKVKESELSGVTTGTPKKNEGGPKGTESGALGGAKAGGGSAAGQTVLPRHRSAVGRYFDRK
ncbi:MAG: hypothetical protein K2W96_20225 [Gemmataceae bacterium]|nr:hypothetical protein [Gemmataceae bacterium]